jgi:CRP-like cAMP-binding protein
VRFRTSTTGAIRWTEPESTDESANPVEVVQAKLRQENRMGTRPRTTPDHTRNALAKRMTGATLALFQAKAATVEFRFGDILYETNVEQEHVYFPTSGVVSLLYLMHSGASAEIALTGRDGLVGLATILEGGQTTSRAMVQVPGQGYRIGASVLRTMMESDSDFRRILLRYAQAVMTQMSQTAVCNRHHTMTQQLARWILQSIDLAEASEIRMTQQLMAEMLGVRREGISAVAGQLKADGVIEYVRGNVRVLSRPGLEARVCECYDVVVAEIRRLLP